MKVIFVSNYLTHHQIPFCNELYALFGEDFRFVSTGSMEGERIAQGWTKADQYPYEIYGNKAYKLFLEVKRLVRESDVVILGDTDKEFLKDRLESRREGITLCYSERIYKKGTWRCLSPRGIYHSLQTYTRYHGQKLYMLCAGAYTSRDLMLHGTYLGRCYKWGYFPETYTYSKVDLNLHKEHKEVRLLWCGRFLDWKHPEDVIHLAHQLHREHIRFHLTLIGMGEEEPRIQRLIKDYELESRITHHRAMSPERVRRFMEEANIFISTSDFQEGWGAVINEAMNSGCAVVASHAAGAAPYLIKDGINGFLYEYGNPLSLYDKTKHLIENRKFCDTLGHNAYETIQRVWNAKEATRRLLLLIEDLNKKGFSDRYTEGPCSKAEIISNHWYEDREIDKGW